MLKNILGWWLILELLIIIMRRMTCNSSNIKELVGSILFTTILFTMFFVGAILAFSV